MKIQYILTAVCLLLFPNLFSRTGSPGESPLSFEEIKNRGEQFYREKSFALAHQEYEKTKTLELNAEQSPWAAFRLADTKWRSFAGSESSDPSPLLEARQALEDLSAELERRDQVSELWVAVNESLGDSWWFPRRSRNWPKAWNYYAKILDWWAGSKDIRKARDHYLAVIWKLSGPPDVQPYYYYGSYGNYLPLPVLENVIKISLAPEDKAHAHYLTAMTLRNSGGRSEQMARVGKEFEAAIQFGKKTGWHDDALYHYAVWASQYGSSDFDENGDLQLNPDYEKALALYRRILSDYKKGETRYYDNARNAIGEITKLKLSVQVSNVYLPGSEVQINLNWRNIETVEVNLFPVNLVEAVHFAKGNQNPWQWLDTIETDAVEPFKTLSVHRDPERPFYPLSEEIRLKDEISPGAYLVEARGKGISVRDILLITDSTLILKTAENQVLGYFADSFNGAPIPEAPLIIWERSYEAERWSWKRVETLTDENGLSQILFAERDVNRQFFASAATGERQAFALSVGNYSTYRESSGQWRVYAYADRPAYRPKDTVHWKIIARREEGDSYRVPTDAKIAYRIHNPKGETVAEGELKLNAFGSAWGELELEEEMVLGAYGITFREGKENNFIGNASFFRLEEYKLPEFKVGIELGSKGAEGKDTFRTGDKVSGFIRANYYFGGAVPDAEVELLVYQRPFNHWFRPLREFQWYYRDMDRPRSFFGGGGSLILRQSLKTDPAGAVPFSFETPRNPEQDFEYSIEARVFDASRREIVAKKTIRVTRRSYFVRLQPEHLIYQPGDGVEIKIRTVDANDRPVSVEGRLRLTRERWREVWIDRRGREISGEEMEELRKKSNRLLYFGASAIDYRLKEKGYEVEEFEIAHLKTDDKGEGLYRFKVPREGFFKIAWVSREAHGQPIKSETGIWASRDDDTEIGYRPGGVAIVADKDTFRVGETASVMVTTPTSGRYVLFCVGANELLTHELIQLEGTVKLLRIKIGEEHSPNSYLDALMVAGNELFLDQQPIVVPPLKNFLKVELSAGAEGFQPKEEGLYAIRVTDEAGNPVSAEVSFGLVDAAVYSLQSEMAPDIRQFFYGEKRSYEIGTSSTFAQKPYFKPAEELEPERERLEAEGMAGVNRLQPIKDNGLRREGEEISSILSASVLKEARSSDQSGMNPPPFQEAAVRVRSDFRSDIYWQPDIHTDENGRAQVKVQFPDTLTTWKATARGVALKSRFGGGEVEVQTRLPLIARLQAPRFFLTGDRLLVSGIYNNNTPEPMDIRALLEAGDALEIEGIRGEKGDLINSPSNRFRVPGNGELRVDWQVLVKSSGKVNLKLTGAGRDYADAMEKSFPVYEHGIEKFIGKSGRVRGNVLAMVLDLPAERKRESTALEIQVTPSVAVAMLDALPYLIDYPYGCTEQTMSRFLPAVIVAKTLGDLGFEKQRIEDKLFSGLESESLSAAHPEGKRDLRMLETMVNRGLKRLYEFQHPSGAWGWWKEGADDPFMTAYVVWGLALAENAGIGVEDAVYRRAASFLKSALVDAESDFELQAWMLHALSTPNRAKVEMRPDRFEAAALLNLMKNRDRLTAYARALLALTAWNYGLEEDAGLLLRNLRNGVKIDRNPDASLTISRPPGQNPGLLGTAHWGSDGFARNWSEGGVEATAFALIAMLAVDPNNNLIEPVMNWLVKNRRGAQWSNTRATAIAVLALNNYLKTTGEMDAVLDYELLLNGKLIAETKVTLSNILKVPSVFKINRNLILDGENTIEIRRKSGEGSIYFSVQAGFFSLEDPIPAHGKEFFIERHYYRIKNVPTLLKGFVEEKEPLKEGDTIESNDRIEVVLSMEGKNNFEYLLLEDLKPAGFEAVQLHSGEPNYAREIKAKEPLLPNAEARNAAPVLDDQNRFTGRERWVYQELRDRGVTSFIDKLPEGLWEIRYRLRAETPGYFHALPVLGKAMYAPEIRANGTEIRLNIVDRKERK